MDLLPLGIKMKKAYLSGKVLKNRDGTEKELWIIDYNYFWETWTMAFAERWYMRIMFIVLLIVSFMERNMITVTIRVVLLIFIMASYEKMVRNLKGELKKANGRDKVVLKSMF